MAATKFTQMSTKKLTALLETASDEDKVEKFYCAIREIHSTSSELTGKAEKLALLIKDFT